MVPSHDSDKENKKPTMSAEERADVFMKKLRLRSNQASYVKTKKVESDKVEPEEGKTEEGKTEEGKTEKGEPKEVESEEVKTKEGDRPGSEGNPPSPEETAEAVVAKLQEEKRREWRSSARKTILVVVMGFLVFAGFKAKFASLGRGGNPRHQPRSGRWPQTPPSPPSPPPTRGGWNSWFKWNSAASGTQPKCTVFHVNTRARFEETRLVFKDKQVALACYSGPGHYACMVSGLGSNTTRAESNHLEGAMWTLVSWPSANASFNKEAFLEGYDRRPSTAKNREDMLLSKPGTKLATVSTLWPHMFNISRQWNREAANWSVRFICGRRFECLSCKKPFVLTRDSVWDGATVGVQYTDQFCVGANCLDKGKPVKASNRTTLSTHQLYEGRDVWSLMCLKRGAEVLGSGEACTRTPCSWVFSLRQLILGQS